MDKTMYKGYYLKLRITEDADVIAVLDAVKNRQGYIRDLIRKDIYDVDDLIHKDMEDAKNEK